VKIEAFRMIPLLRSFGILRVNVPLGERSLQPVAMTLRKSEAKRLNCGTGCGTI